MLPVSLPCSGSILLASCLMSGMAFGVEGDPEIASFTYRDIRVGYSSAAAPVVRERVEYPGGAHVDNTWDGGDAYGSRLDLTYLHGTGSEGWGPLYGLQLAFGHYTLGDANSSTGTATYSNVFLDVLYGLQYGVVATPGLHGHIELTPFIGGGTGWFSVGDRKYSAAVEGGVRVGAFLDERDWQLGVTMAGVLGYSHVTADTGLGNESDLTFRTHGFRFGAEAGYRF